MMTKKQKIWMWVFIAMFAVPEILIFTTPSLFASINGKSFYQTSSLFVNYGIFFSHPAYLLMIIAIEFLGILGLFVLNLKFNKKLLVTLLFAILLATILFWLFYIFMVVYVTGISL